MASTERWCGLLKVPLNPKSQTCFSVAASLCLSPSSKTLVAPSANAIFFNGDRVPGMGNPVVEKLSNLQNIASILVSKLGVRVNAWVVDAPLFNGPFAVYKELIPTINSRGEPASYVPDGFPATSSLQLLLFNCLQEAEKIVSSVEKTSSTERHSTPASSTCPKTILLGFSKGGVVLNQLLSELASYESQERHHLQHQDHILPHSMDEFFKSIVEFHYIDVGLNCPGAYPTDHTVINKTRKFAEANNNTIRFVVHGTPRQWSDCGRPWIREDKEKFVHLLGVESKSSNGKLHACERLYFSEQHPSLQMHFEIIECVNLG
ncbi:uncharacterized protein LOC116252334 isoform X2 [Nymphaea colorata]|uniref:uncharacterized protein LOC116252334 isoform X2 n=1 Tax=Nymphaea colorata TaxID=210225 RepID=UPI00129DFA41|nr:uncharacterized protein LOC116252334 isoform X2 [Nymphaea colorata]